MFSTIRPALYLVYGPESRQIAFTHLKKTSRLTPELQGLTSYILLKGADLSLSGEVQQNSENPNQAEIGLKDFEEEAGEEAFIREVSVGNAADLQSVFSEAENRLKRADLWQQAVENGWTVKPGVQPIIVTLIDPSRGYTTDWVNVFATLKRSFLNSEECLIDSFNVLLGLGFSDDSNSLHPDHEAYQHLSYTFTQLQSGDYHPQSDKAWIPQTVFLDGRLDNGVSLTPGSDLRENIADIISSLIGLSLTDNSTFSDKDTVRTAGAIRVGFPKLELIREHREQWLRKYFKEESDNIHTIEVRGYACRQVALDYLQCSKVEGVAKSLAKSLSGQLTYMPDHESANPLENIENMSADFERYWNERVQQIPGRIESERRDFNLSQREELIDSIGEWLKSLSLAECSKVLEMVRGVDNSGLVTHEKTVNDLRSLKVKKIDQLGSYRYSIDSERMESYRRLHDWVQSQGEATSNNSESEAALSKINDEIEQFEVSEVVEGEEAKTGSKTSVNHLKTKKRKLESQLSQQQYIEAGYNHIIGSSSNVEKLTLLLNPEASNRQKTSVEAVGLEGWSGKAEKRTLSNGSSFIVPTSEDEKSARDSYYEGLKNLADLKDDLSREPESPISDAEVIRSESLKESIAQLEEETAGLLNECNIAREAVEKYQIAVNSIQEQSFRMLQLKEATSTDLSLAPVYHRFLEYEKDALTKKLQESRRSGSDNKEAVKNRFLKQVAGIFVATMLLLFLIPSEKPKILTDFDTALIEPGKQNLQIVVGQRSVRLVLPSGLWTNSQLFKLISGEEVDGERLDATGLRSFKSLLVASYDNGVLGISGSSSVGVTDQLEVMAGSSAAVLLGLQVGQKFYGNQRWLYRAFSLLVGILFSVVLWLQYRRKATVGARGISKFKANIKRKEAELDHWFNSTEAVISLAAEGRLKLSAFEESVKAIDDQAKIVEFVQGLFAKFDSAVTRELKIAKNASSGESELPKSRRFYSIFNREDMRNKILNRRVLESDERNFKEFKREWSYSRIWKSFSESQSITDWLGHLNRSADESYRVLIDTSLEQLLTANPEILSSSDPLVHSLRENCKALGELCGIADPDERTRAFLCTKNDESNAANIRKRMQLIWTEEAPSFVSEGTKSEMLMAVLRPNLKGRRILAVQNGLASFFKRPFGEVEDLLIAIGNDMDSLCNIHQMENLSQAKGYGGQEARWQVLIREFAVNSMWHEGIEIRGFYDQAEFFYNDIRLGGSVVELLFRLDGYGLTGQQAIDVAAIRSEKPGEGKCVSEEQYYKRREILDHWFFDKLRHLDIEVFKYYENMVEEIDRGVST